MGFLREAIGIKGCIVSSYLQRVDREVATTRNQVSAWREEIERIHQRIKGGEERLHHLEITRQTLRSLPEDEATSDTLVHPTSAVEVSTARQDSRGSARPPITIRPGTLFEPGEPTDLEEGRRRILVVLATAGRALSAREIAAAIGEDVSTPSRVETTRARLKRLARSGQVVEGPIGSFAITTVNSAPARLRAAAKD
ncbi:hypothetical protein [Streptomyces anulatus]|uniref:hypothetical protein n=1 Tax=Streptomyces anulatus TaxID=1892 RepID=UPI00386716CC